MDDRQKARAILEDDVAVGKAIERGVRASLIRHARLGEQVVIWRDNKVCWLPAAELLTPEEIVQMGATAGGVRDRQ
jgi:hypothetical protein